MGYYSELAYDTEVCETNEAPSGKGGEAVISGDALSAFGEGDFIPPQAVPGSSSSAGTPPQSVEKSTPPAQDAEAPKATKTEEEENEDAARKAHKEAEAKRKEEWEAKHKATKQAEQEAIQAAMAMSEQEALKAAVTQVRTGTEKLTRRNMKECVSEYIQTKCLEDTAFARLILHPRKSMVHCFQYINRKSYDYIQDELKASGFKPGPDATAYGCDIPDDLCYSWAEEYFRNPEAKEDQEQEEKFVPRPYVKKSKPVKATAAKSADKGSAGTNLPKGKDSSKPKPESGQITLGGFDTLGKAG